MNGRKNDETGSKALAKPGSAADAGSLDISSLSDDECRAIEGMYFNIQPYSIHDGPGIRTTVFVSGCPLRCRWCQNPESYTSEPKLFFMEERCIGCGACIEACPNGAVLLRGGKAVTNRETCDGCGLCVGACPAGARSIEGLAGTAGEVASKVLEDKMFLAPSGGGVTVSGGEVLSQPRFVASILRLCKSEGLTTCIETSGMGSRESLHAVLEYCDIVLLDLKNMDSQRHKWGTGVANERILQNSKAIYHECKKKMRIRMPVIPGFNDSVQNIDAMCDFICNELGSDVAVDLLPYHDLGDSKLDRMEQPEAGRFESQTPTDEQMESLKARVESFGLQCHIGG